MTRCVTLSDFNIDNFNALLSNNKTSPAVDVVSTDYGQIHQYILDPNADCWADRPEYAVVWTRPEAAISSFGDLYNFEEVSLKDILAEVEEFAQLLFQLQVKVDTVLIPSWTMNPEENGLGLLDMRSEIGFKNTLMRMNLRLAEALKDAANIFILDSEKWLRQDSQRAYNDKLWAMAKIPFTNQVFRAAASDVKSAMRVIMGESKKLIIVDLDNTLWGGVVGDDGWENLRLGGHDPVGETYVGFQKALKAMTNRGILLGIVSKNDEQVALEAIESHPEMVLSIDDFAGWQINWNDKAQNVARLVESLNLGLQSVVFIDDNPFERARVREALPEVLVPEWPEDPFRYRATLRKMNCFDTATLTEEDRQRASMYISQKKRDAQKTKIDSLDEWLKSLDMKVKVDELNDSNLARTVQLFNKTNQMNLRTRRMSESEILKWLDVDNRKLLTFRVSDKFGDSGLTGILSFEVENHTAHLSDFILSCRVMGRKVEETMVFVAMELAKEMGAREMVAEYLPTEKNKPCLEFWEQSGFRNEEAKHVFRWDMSKEYPLPVHINLVQN